VESILQPAKSTGPDIRNSHYRDVKARIHEQLLNRLNLERLSQVRREEAEPELRSVIGTLLETEAEKTPLSLYERESIVTDVLNELFGLGPLEHLLLDGEISDILVNRYNQIFVERNGLLEPVDPVASGGVRRPDERQLRPPDRRRARRLRQADRRPSARVVHRRDDGAELG
jgi:pilus assembly protein CpaF